MGRAWAVLGLVPGLVPCLKRARAKPGPCRAMGRPGPLDLFLDPGPAQVFVPCQARPINIRARAVPCLI
ncbi:hypothetical protein ACE6H2_001846 [Prunus campanulata]